jgi:hypothetical protein
VKEERKKILRMIMEHDFGNVVVMASVGATLVSFLAGVSVLRVSLMPTAPKYKTKEQ